MSSSPHNSDFMVFTGNANPVLAQEISWASTGLALPVNTMKSELWGEDDMTAADER